MDMKDYQCDICHKYFNWRANLIAHLRIHTDERPHVCSVCGQAFRKKTSLTYHTERYHPAPGQELFHCKACSTSFSNSEKLRKHEINAHSDSEAIRNHGCSECDKSFKRKILLLYHLREVHNDESALPPIRKFACLECNKTFKRRFHLKEHRMEVHEKVKNYQCNICHVNFARRDHLKTHLRIHTGEKPFLCSICGMAFTRRSTLTYHTRNMHSEPSRDVFKCETCGKLCPNRVKLIRHKNTHSDARNHVCSKCDKSFKHSSHLKAHLSEVHNDESVSHLMKHFECPECKKIFKSKSNLNKHQKTVHKKVNTAFE